MFDTLFGWRKASKCKKLIKRFQCRLKLLKSKRYAIARQSREDIFQLLKNGYQQIAFNRLDELYMDENMILVYEFLDQFSEFIILNISYIRKHKDLLKDMNEAVSTLIFASARCGNIPELMLLRKLFRERYGNRYTTIAVELHPGNRVNQQVKEKLTSNSVSQDVKNRMLNEIIKEFLYKPRILPRQYKTDFQVQQEKGTELYEDQEVIGLEYKPGFEAQSKKITRSYEDEGQDKCSNTSSKIPANTRSIVLKSSPSMVETPKCEKMLNFAVLSSPYECETGAIKVREVEEDKKSSSCSSENSTYYSEDSVIYLDDVQEFQSPAKQGKNCEDQDQRFFMFSFSSFDDTKLAKKNLRMRSSSGENTIDDMQCKVYYGYRSSNQKNVQFEEPPINCLVDHGNEKVETSDDNNEGGEIVLMWDHFDSPLAWKCHVSAPYTADATMSKMEIISTESSKSNLALARHVHPKLPDYDEIAAKFRELKKIHQQSKCIRF